MSGAGHPASEASLGLVYSSTTQTRLGRVLLPEQLLRQNPQAFGVVERIKSRLRKMKHGVITNARLMEETCARQHGRMGRKKWWCAFVTLTYKPGEAWQPNHLRDTLTAAREWHKRLGIKMRYVWVAEMQERGAVHYHVIFWMPNGYKLPKFDTRGWWPYGSSEVKKARNPVGYLAKYASKGDDGPAFPKGIRINGAGGLDIPARIEARYWRAPQAAREFLGVLADIRRTTGGRFDAHSGLFWDSPWRMVRIAGQFVMTKLSNPEIRALSTIQA